MRPIDVAKAIVKHCGMDTHIVKDEFIFASKLLFGEYVLSLWADTTSFHATIRTMD